MEDEEGRIRPDLAAFNLKQDREASEVVLIYLKRQRHKTRTERHQRLFLSICKDKDKGKEASDVVLKSNYKLCHTNCNFLHMIGGADLVFQCSIFLI